VKFHSQRVIMHCYILRLVSGVRSSFGSKLDIHNSEYFSHLHTLSSLRSHLCTDWLTHVARMSHLHLTILNTGHTFILCHHFVHTFSQIRSHCFQNVSSAFHLYEYWSHLLSLSLFSQILTTSNVCKYLIVSKLIDNI